MNNKQHILIVEDDEQIRSLLKRKLESFGYLIDSAENGRTGWEKVQKIDYDLVLTDIQMPIMDGFEMIKRMRAENVDLPVVVILSGHGEIPLLRQALQQGAHDYLLKPFNIEELDLTIKRALEKNRLIRENLDYKLHLEEKVERQTALLWQQLHELEKANETIKKSYLYTVESLCRALEARDRETGAHTERAVEYARKIGNKLNLTEQEQTALHYGSILHDIGKIGIPDHILMKPGKLTREEWDVMKLHPRIGHEILKQSPFLHDALPIVLHHHEHYNGKGYPVGLDGENIPLGARIFAVADAFDAMTSDRPYRTALSKQSAIEELKRYSGTQFDPQIVNIFSEILGSEKDDKSYEA